MIEKNLFFPLRNLYINFYVFESNNKNHIESDIHLTKLCYKITGIFLIP